MHTFRRYLMLILLVFVLSLGSTVQKNQAAENVLMSVYLPLALREEDVLHSFGPQGGSIVMIKVDPKNTSVLYAGSWGSGMYKSVNGGLSWDMINWGLPYLYINSLAIDPQDPSILYAGTYAHGVYKTTDGGASWASTGPGMSPLPIVYTLAVDPVTPNVVYAGTRNQQPGPPWGGGLYKTVDGGASWKLYKSGLSEDWVYDIAVDPVNHDTVYVATHSKGVFKSKNAGAFWEKINDGIVDLSARSIVIDPTNTDIVYVGTWHYGGVYKTINGGITWKPAATGLYHKIYSLNMDPQNPNIIYAGTYRKGIMYTDTAGANWKHAGLNPDLVYNVVVDPRNSNTLFAGTMGDGFYISYDRGESWASTNTGFYAASITALAADWAISMEGTVSIANSSVITDTGVNAVYASIFGSGIYKTTDLGQNWYKVNNGLGEVWVYSMAMSRTDPLTLYAGTDTAGFYISHDGGWSWIAGNNGLPEPAFMTTTMDAWADPLLRSDLFDQAFFEGVPDPVPSAEAATKVVSILSIDVDNFDPLKLYVGTDGQGILRSQNGGVRWFTTNVKTHLVYTIISDPFTPGVLYAGCDSESNSPYRSVDGGVTWQSRNVGAAGLNVYALAADPTVPGTLYAGTSQGIYKSIDGADTWVPFGLSGYIVSTLAISQASPGKIYAGTTNGLYFSNDNGATWNPLNDGLVNMDFTSMALAPAGAQPINFFGTRGSSIYIQGKVIPASK